MEVAPLIRGVGLLGLLTLLCRAAPLELERVGVFFVGGERIENVPAAPNSRP